MVQDTLIKDLDKKPYRLWAGDESVVTGLVCLFVPKCEFCGHDMEFWCAKPIKFSINDGDDVPRSHACDVEMWCPECKSWDQFGVAISKEHYEDLSKWCRRQNHVNYYTIQKDIPS